MLNGCGPPARAPHVSSPPRASPGKISCLVRGLIAVAYSLRTLSTCGAVRQFSPSPAAHWIDFGSNAHRSGFSIDPSVTPSLASHAAITALLITRYFAGGMKLAGSLSVADAAQIVPAIRCVQKFAGAPATMPL